MKKVLLSNFLLFGLFVITQSVSAETVKIYGLSEDGTVSGQRDTSWDVARNSEMGTLLDINGGGIDSHVQIHDSLYLVTRSFYFFDTSVVPDDAEISSVKFGVHTNITHNSDNDEFAYMGVYQAEKDPSSPLTLDDFGLCGDDSTTLGSQKVDIDDITPSTYVEFIFNESGKGWVEKDGYTKLCLKDGHDAENQAIDGDQFTYSGIRVKSADTPGTEFDPYLEITYSVPEVDDEVDRAEFIALVREATSERKYKLAQRLLVHMADSLFDSIEGGRTKLALVQLRVFEVLLRAKGIEYEPLTAAIDSLQEGLRE